MRSIIKKRGGDFFNVLIVAAAIGLVLVIGVILAFGGMTVKWISDNIIPSVSELGMAGDANLTQIATYTAKPIQNVTNSITWMSGIMYVLALIMLLGLAFVFRMNGNKWMMVLFFICMFILEISSIFLSNIYQDFYDDGGEVGTALHEMALLSFMILNSPVIIIGIGFICGIIMFTGGNDENVY